MSWSIRMTAEVIYLCSVLAGIAMSRPVFETDEQTSEYVIVQRLAGHIQRNKRSSGLEFPHKTTFRFKMAGGHVVLDLELSAHARKEFPVYTISESGVVLRSTEKQDHLAVYQDVSRGASVLLKCPSGLPGEFQLLGEFTYNNNHYQIEPVTSFHRDKSDDVTAVFRDKRHVVKRQAVPYSDFDGDTLVPPFDNTGLHAPSKTPLSAVLPDKKEVVPNVLPLKMFKQGDGQGSLENDMLTPPLTASSRSLRQADTLYIEYLVVADYRNFQRWKEKVSGSTEEEIMNNAFNAMSEYYQYIVNGIDLRFRASTGSVLQTRVVFTSLLVSTEEITSPWIQNNRLGENTVDDARMLYSFAVWRNSVYQYLPNHDHAALFTGFDIATPSSTSPIGMGYLNSICHDTWAVSETEEAYSAMTVHIAAHELGHNTGARHDGSGNSCSSSALNLMAPRLPFVYDPASRANPWRFSSCSQTSIRTYISGLASDSCLTNKPGNMTYEWESDNDDGAIPAGIKYSADDQCNMTYGGDAVLCRENLHGRWDTVCYAMQCKKKGANHCEDRLFPFDRTPCGDKKWCRAGQCVYSEDAPAIHSTCPFGDDPTVYCSLDSSCKDSDVRSKDTLCCGTCLGLDNNFTTSTTSSLATPTSGISALTSLSTPHSSSPMTISSTDTTAELRVSSSFSSLSLSTDLFSSTSTTDASTEDVRSSNATTLSVTIEDHISNSNSKPTAEISTLTSTSSTQSLSSSSTSTDSSTLFYDSTSSSSSTISVTTPMSTDSVSSTETSTTPDNSTNGLSVSTRIATDSNFSPASTTSSVAASTISTSRTSSPTKTLSSTFIVTATELPNSVSTTRTLHNSSTSIATNSDNSRYTSTDSIPISSKQTVIISSRASAMSLTPTDSTAKPLTNSGTISTTFTSSTFTVSPLTTRGSTSTNSTTHSKEVMTASTVPANVSTLTTSSTSAMTDSQLPPTDEPKTILSLKLQTLVSLFMAAALVV